MARCGGRRAVDRGMVKLQVLAFMLVMAYMLLMTYMMLMAYMMLVTYMLLMAYMMLMTLKASAVKGVRCIC